jgi:hypothetical protein
MSRDIKQARLETQKTYFKNRKKQTLETSIIVKKI